MSDPYVGEIRMFGGNFAPLGWMFCAGQQLPISEYDTLFTLIGTTYGGDGQETFNLPDLQGRIPIHQGSVGGTQFTIGENAGTESVTLSGQQTPVHNHIVLAVSDTGSLPDPGNHFLARTNTPGQFLYIDDAPDVQLSNQSVTPAGGSQPHDNTGPFLCISYIISLYGIFPSQN